MRTSFCTISLLLGLLTSATWADVITPFRMTPQFEQAIVLLERGDLMGADALFAKVVESDPGYPQALLGRAQVALTQKRLVDAERTVSEVLARQPTLPEAHNMRGVLLVTQNRNTEAQQAFRQAIKLRSTYVTPYVYLAAIARSAGDFEAAASAYEELIGVAPRLAAAYLGQAEALFMLRRDGEAIAVFAAWKAADPKNPMPSQVLGNVFNARKEYSRAIQELSRAIQAFPGDAAMHVALGDAYALSGDPQNAAARFEQASMLEPKNIDALVKLGTLRAERKDTEGAAKAFRQALAVDPGHAGASNNLAWVLADAGRDLDEALKLAVASSKANPTYVDAQDTLGWVRYRRGEYALAVSILEGAKKLAPSRNDIAAHLGLAYAKAGKTSQAIAELRRALARPEQIVNRDEVQAELNRLLSLR